jgi:hypothetical protein
MSTVSHNETQFSQLQLNLELSDLICPVSKPWSLRSRRTHLTEHPICIVYLYEIREMFKPDHDIERLRNLDPLDRHNFGF